MITDCSYTYKKKLLIHHPSSISIPSIQLCKNVHVADESPTRILTPLKLSTWTKHFPINSIYLHIGRNAFPISNQNVNFPNLRSKTWIDFFLKSARMGFHPKFSSVFPSGHSCCSNFSFREKWRRKAKAKNRSTRKTYWPFGLIRGWLVIQKE